MSTREIQRVVNDDGVIRNCLEAHAAKMSVLYYSCPFIGENGATPVIARVKIYRKRQWGYLLRRLLDTPTSSLENADATESINYIRDLPPS